MERDRGRRVKTEKRQRQRDRQEMMVPRRGQLMQHLWQTSGCEKRACCFHGGRCCRTSYRHLTASCTPEHEPTAVRQDEKPWGQHCTVLLMYSILTRTYKHRYHIKPDCSSAGITAKRCATTTDRQTETHQATESASLASHPGDTQDVTHNQWCSG